MTTKHEVTYNPLKGEIVVYISENHMQRINPKYFRKVVVPGIGVFTKTEELRNVSPDKI